MLVWLETSENEEAPAGLEDFGLLTEERGEFGQGESLLADMADVLI